jgi:DNA-binding response OmpR family regulator
MPLQSMAERDASGDRRPAVLCVDDDLLVRESLVRFLRRCGFDAAAVGDPQSAVDYLAGSHVDAVILDVRLSNGASGLDVLKWIRRHSDLSELPVIVLTGVYFLAPAETNVIRTLGAAVIYKPEIGPKLVRRLESLVQRKPAEACL